MHMTSMILEHVKRSFYFLFFNFEILHLVIGHMLRVVATQIIKAQRKQVTRICIHDHTTKKINILAKTRVQQQNRKQLLEDIERVL